MSIGLLYTKTYNLRLILLIVCLLSFKYQLFAENINVSGKELKLIANKIYINECGGKTDNLTHWNKGENFASLGIGHFIWYPKGAQRAFSESFPNLLKYLKKNKVRFPQWLDDCNYDCPWSTRKDFYNQFNSTKMKSLRILLRRAINLQAKFMFLRLEKALPKILLSIPHNEGSKITFQFYRIAKSPFGMYALIDYVNFKGEGVNKTERYKGHGWGLLQVLQCLNGTTIGINAIKEFQKSAICVLARRVDNSPMNRNEIRWLPGWVNRINTY